MVKYAFLLTCLSAGLLNGQPVEVGVKGAVSLTGTSPYDFWHEESKRYQIGPYLEVRLPSRFAIEVDALYQRVGSSQSFRYGPAQVQIGSEPATSVQGVWFNRLRGNSWQFPILAKYYLRDQSAAWQPFVSLGPSIRRVGSYTDTNQLSVDQQRGAVSYNIHSEYTNWTVGGTAAAGVRWHKGRFAITPEFRFTRWAQNNGNNLSRNAAAIFLGFGF